MQSDQYQSASSYAHIELSMYFNVRHMALIVCIIESGKSPFSAISILFIYIYIAATLLFTDKIATLVQMARSVFRYGGFLGINHTQSCNKPHQPLLCIVSSVIQGSVDASLPHSLAKSFYKAHCNPPLTLTPQYTSSHHPILPHHHFTPPPYICNS